MRKRKSKFIYVGNKLKATFMLQEVLCRITSLSLDPQKLDDNNWAIYGLCKPDKPIPIVDIQEDTGKFVAAFLEEPEKYEGKFLAGATRLYTINEIAKLEVTLTGKNVKYVTLSKEDFYRTVPSSLAGPVSSMFTFINDFGYYGPETKEIVKWSTKQSRGKHITMEDFFVKSPPLIQIYNAHIRRSELKFLFNNICLSIKRKILYKAFS